MLANFRALFGVVIDIVLLRRGPEHLPASAALLVSTVALFSVFAVVSALAMGSPAAQVFLELAALIAVTLLWYRVALRLANKGERFLQTATAIFAVLALFAPLAIPLQYEWLTQYRAFIETKAAEPSTSLSLITFALLLWLFVVNVRIVRGAFEWPGFPSVMLVVAYQFALQLTLAVFVGVRAPPG